MEIMKEFNKQSRAMIVGAFSLAMISGIQLTNSVEVYAGELPKDVVNSVMWEDIANDHLLSDKASSGKVVMDKRILLHTPKKAEDQMNIPIHVDARAIPNVKKIVLLADLNPIPRVLTYLPKKAEPRLSVRIKIEQGTPIRAAVLDDKGVWHIAARYIDTAAGGGCSQPAVAHGQDDWFKNLAKVKARVWREPAKQTTKMRLSVKHPMDTGLAPGHPAFYIEKLNLKTPGGEMLGQLFLHEPVSENPTLTLFPKLKASTNKVILKGRDNHGNLIKATVPAPYHSSKLQ